MNEPALILVVEDEDKIARLLSDYLEKAGGYRTHLVTRGDEALASFEKYQPDLVLLDLMLPGLGGLEVCKAIRATSTVPIIMVTALVEEIDKLLGLEIGADDYICKPFSPREVVARVKANLRRVAFANGREEVAGLHVDEQRHCASLHGQAIRLTPVEFSLLAHLVAHPGQVFSRQQLMDVIYSDYRVVSDRTVDTHVKKLRRALANAGGQESIIESVYGVGYRLSPQRAD
jgi:two-component system response regulator BaeR